MSIAQLFHIAGGDGASVEVRRRRPSAMPKWARFRIRERHLGGLRDTDILWSTPAKWRRYFREHDPREWNHIRVGRYVLSIRSSE